MHLYHIYMSKSSIFLKELIKIDYYFVMLIILSHRGLASCMFQNSLIWHLHLIISHTTFRFALAFYGSSSNPRLVALVAQVSISIHNCIPHDIFWKPVVLNKDIEDLLFLLLVEINMTIWFFWGAMHSCYTSTLFSTISTIFSNACLLIVKIIILNFIIKFSPFNNGILNLNVPH